VKEQSAGTDESNKSRPAGHPGTGTGEEGELGLKWIKFGAGEKSQNRARAAG